MPRIGDPPGNLPAQNVQAQGVAHADAEPPSDPRIEGDQRWSPVIGGPPIPADDFGSLGLGADIGEPAVAPHRPPGAVSDARGLNGFAVRPHDAPAHGRQAVDPPRPGHVLDGGLEARHLAGLDIDKKEGRRAGRDTLNDLPAQIALHLDQGHEHRQSDAKGDDDGPGRCAGPVDVGQGQGKPGPSHLALCQTLGCAAGNNGDPLGEAVEKGEGECCTGDEPEREAGPDSGGKRQPGDRRQCEAKPNDNGGGGAKPRVRNEAPEKLGGGHLPGPG